MMPPPVFLPQHSPSVRRRSVALLSLSLLAGAMLSLPPGAQAAIVAYDLEKLTRRSELILTGEVIEVSSYRAPFHNLGEVIFTDVKIRIESSLKGTPVGKEVTVQLLGGTIGTSFQICLESARYKKGEKVLVFLRKYQGRFWNTGWFQGKYRITAGNTLVEGKKGLPVAAKTTLADLTARIRAILYPSSSTPPQPSTPPQSSGSGGQR